MVDSDWLPMARTINGLTINTGILSSWIRYQSEKQHPGLVDSSARWTRHLLVNLDFAERTLGAVKAAIELAAGYASVLQVGYSDDQITLVDKTTPTGNDHFKVSAINDAIGLSPIGMILGILGEEVPVEDNPDTEDLNEFSAGDTILGAPLF